MSNIHKLFALAEEVEHKLLDQEISGFSEETQQVMNEIEKKIFDLKIQMEELESLKNILKPKSFTTNIMNEKFDRIFAHLSRCVGNYKLLETDFNIKK